MSADSTNPSPEELASRKRWFEEYCKTIDENSVSKKHIPGLNYACPCCKYLTLSERGGFEICPVCFWEDDGQDDHNAQVAQGGPNGRLSLEQARKNFAAFGASDERRRTHVRAPNANEMPR